MRRRVTAVVGSVRLSSDKSHLTSGASVRPENSVTYLAGNGGQNICGIFSETTPLRRSSTHPVESHTYGRQVFSTWWRRGFCTLVHSFFCVEQLHISYGMPLANGIFVGPFLHEYS